MSAGGDRSALGYCLLLSGAAALVYEVVWLRQISLVMGHTALALSALLTAFLGGLALGSAIGGRLTARKLASARQYAVLELLIAGSALLVPAAVEALDPAFGAAYRAFGDRPLPFGLAQLALCSLALAAPCVLMGATLPIVVSVVTPPERPITGAVGRLYALNGLGGVLGAAAAGLLLLPALGESKTTFVAAGLNALAAAFALLISFEDEAPAPTTPPADESPAAPAPPPLPAGRLAVLYGLGGFAALVLQVGWARLVTLSVGSTVSGFTITLVGFIGGLTAGSAVGARIRWLRAAPVRALVALHAGIGLWTLISLPWMGALPSTVAALMGSDLDFGPLWAAQLGLVFTTIAVPTFAMGAIFPLVSELLRRAGGGPGAAVGGAYAANTLGNILGAAVAGFVVMPAIGMRATVVASAVLSVLVALAYLPALRHRKQAFIGVGLAALTLLLAVALPGWDRDVVSSGPFLRGYQGGRNDARPVEGKLVDYIEGPTTVAAVRDRGHLQELYVGGISEASSNSPMHLYLAHQAMLLHPDAKDVLLIGLGTGRTLGALIQYPVEAVDCMELSPEVVTLAQRHFADGIALAFEDPRVKVRVQDGRSHLRHGQTTYDVIVSQPSYPWAAGAARLFTAEYFAQMRDALAPGGVAVAWFPTRDETTAASIEAAWRQAFDAVEVFSPDDRYKFRFAVGFAPGSQLDVARIRKALSYPKAARAAGALGIRGPSDLLGNRKAFFDLDVPVNTDDNGYVEHAAFRALMDGRRELP